MASQSFRNDYSEGAAPEILSALERTNLEQTVGYTEGDPFCEHARELVRNVCGAPDAMVEFCIGGTSANLICVNGLLRDWEGVICTADAHINVHETGAIAATGRTVLATRDDDAFVSVEEAERVWQRQTSTGRHMTLPRLAYLTDATEFGGVWDRARFDALCDWADAHRCAVYVDGARLANALCAEGSDLSLRHIASRVAALTLGGTKNGMLFGEAVLINDPRLKEAFPFLQKERGGLLAKGRLLGVQFEAALEGGEGEGLWWRLARHANRMASKLRTGLLELGYEAFSDSPTNQQFFTVPAKTGQRFCDEFGCEVFDKLGDGRWVVRFVSSWATRPEAVAEVIELAGTLAR